MKKRKQLLIIGCGIDGMSKAFFFSRMRDAAGELMYDVTMLDANPQPGQGTTASFSRAHKWGEYPKGGRTALHTLVGTTMMEMGIPYPGLFTNEAPMRFLVSKETHKAGLEGKEGGLTLDEFLSFYSGIKPAQQEIIRIIEKHSKLPPKTIAEWIGDTEHLMRIVKQRDLDVHDFYGGNVEGGVETRERGIDILRFMFVLEKALRKHGEIHGNVNIFTDKDSNKKVVCVDDVTNGGKITGYNAVCADGSVYYADRVIQCLGPLGFEIDGPKRNPDQHEEITVCRHAILEVDISGIDPELLPPSTMILKGEHRAGMVSIHGNIARVYNPVTAHREEDVEVLNSAIPEKRSLSKRLTEPLSPEEEAEWMKDYMEKVIAVFPVLKDAKPARLKVGLVPISGKRDERLHQRVKKIGDGDYWSSCLYKGCYAWLSAIETMEIIKAEERGEPMPPPIDEEGGIERLFQAMLTSPEYNMYEPGIDPETKGLVPVPVLDFNDDFGFAEYLHEHNLPLSAMPGIGRIPYGPATRLDVDGYWARRFAEQWMPSATVSRSFGIGFGPYKVKVFEDTNPKTGPVLDRDPEKNKLLCGKLAAWLDLADDQRPPLTPAVIPQQAICNAMANRFLHANMVTLMNVMTPIWEMLSEKTVELLFGTENLEGWPHDLWERIQNSMKKKSGLPGIWTMRQFQEINSRELTNTEEVATVMLASLFMRLPNDKKAYVALEIAEHMKTFGSDKWFFAKMADPEVNIPVLVGGDEPQFADKISNTGRAIMVSARNTDESRVGIKFQGEIFWCEQFHIHLTDVPNTDGKPDGELEFQHFTNRGHMLRCERERSDPNTEARGELHYILRNDKGRALLIGAHIKEGDENSGLKPVTDILDKHGVLEKNQPIPLEEIAFDPLGCFNKGNVISEEPRLLAPFVSLFLAKLEEVEKPGEYIRIGKGGNSTFAAGVHTILMPDSQAVTISPQQLAIMRRALPKLEIIIPAFEVRPIELAAGL